jgi:hypothetical protein
LCPLVCPAFPRFGSGRALAGGAGRGCSYQPAGPWVVENRCVQACCQGQLCGRCMNCPEFRSGRFVWFQAAFVTAWDW